MHNNRNLSSVRKHLNPARRLKDPMRQRSHIRKVRKRSLETGNTPQPFTSPFTGHWAAKTTEEDPARGPAMR